MRILSYRDVILRWCCIENEAKKLSIKKVAYSADGDTRLMKAMKLQSAIPCNSENNLNRDWFKMDINACENQQSHDKHLLVKSNLKPEDKINFWAAEKMCSDQACDLLKLIPDSEGTQVYLKVINYSFRFLVDKYMP